MRMLPEHCGTCRREVGFLPIRTRGLVNTLVRVGPCENVMQNMYTIFSKIMQIIYIKNVLSQSAKYILSNLESVFTKFSERFKIFVKYFANNCWSKNECLKYILKNIFRTFSKYLIIFVKYLNHTCIIKLFLFLMVPVLHNNHKGNSNIFLSIIQNLGLNNFRKIYP